MNAEEKAAMLEDARKYVAKPRAVMDGIAKAIVMLLAHPPGTFAQAEAELLLRSYFYKAVDGQL